MAQVKLFKFDTDGYQVEQNPSTDDITALSITAGTGGVTVNGSLEMNDEFISGVAAPTNLDHGVNKAYVDAVAQGLDPHVSVRLKTAVGIGEQAELDGSGLGPTISLGTESMDIKIDSDASWTTITFNNETTIIAAKNAINTQYGASIASAAGDSVKLRSLFYGSSARIQTQNVDANITTQTGIVNNADVSGVGMNAAGSGVGKTLTSPGTGLDWNLIDGQNVEVGDRVLVSNENGVAAHVDNGIYTVTRVAVFSSTTMQLTRATDCDEVSDTEFHNGTYVFVTAGTVNEGTGWSCATDMVAVDTTANLWAQFSGAPGITYDQGLIKDVSSVQVSLDTNADAATTGAGGGSSGLEFDVDTASGQLRVRVSSTGGIDRLADGIGLDLDGTTLQLDSGGAGEGVSVKGVPSTFEINESAVSANVTHTALGVLTAGASSDADAYHTHDGKSDSDHTHAHSTLTDQGTDDHHAKSHDHSDSSLAHSVLTGQGTDDHHAQEHALDGGDHSVTGLTAGDVLTASGATTFGFSTPVSDHAEFEATAGTGGVTKGDPVYLSANGTVLPCDNTNNNTRRFCGVALETKAQTETVRIQQDGKLTDVTIGGSPSGGDLVYLNSTNGLTVTLPTGSGTHRMVIGKVFDDTSTPDLVIEPQYLGKIG